MADTSVTIRSQCDIGVNTYGDTLASPSSIILYVLVRLVEASIKSTGILWKKMHRQSYHVLR